MHGVMGLVTPIPTGRVCRSEVFACRRIWPVLLAAAIGVLSSCSPLPDEGTPGRSGPAAAELPRRPPDVHFPPTPQPVVDAMLELARVGPNDVVYDLGSGDGRIVIEAARKYGAHGVGIELDPQACRTGHPKRGGGRRRRMGHLQGRGYLRSRHLEGNCRHAVPAVDARTIG